MKLDEIPGLPRPVFALVYGAMLWSPLAPLLCGIGVAYVVWSARRAAVGVRKAWR